MPITDRGVCSVDVCAWYVYGQFRRGARSYRKDVRWEEGMGQGEWAQRERGRERERERKYKRERQREKERN